MNGVFMGACVCNERACVSIIWSIYSTRVNNIYMGMCVIKVANNWKDKNNQHIAKSNNSDSDAHMLACMCTWTYKTNSNSNYSLVCSCLLRIIELLTSMIPLSLLHSFFVYLFFSFASVWINSTIKNLFLILKRIKPWVAKAMYQECKMNLYFYEKFSWLKVSNQCCFENCDHSRRTSLNQ